MVNELLQHVGMEGCGWSSGGVDALKTAAVHEQLEKMDIIMTAGVADTGSTLEASIENASLASVRFLLKQHGSTGYVNTPMTFGRTPLICCVWYCHSCSPKMVRLLVNAGADTTSPIRVTDVRREALFEDTPLYITTTHLREKIVGRDDASEEQLHRLEAMRRSIIQVEAVHAVSWLWVIGNNAAEGVSAAKTTSPPLTAMLPVLRRRALMAGMVWTPPFRCA